MAKHKLSETRIRTLIKAGIYSDGDGLFLRVRATGSKQWFFIYKRQGKRTEIGLGGYGQGTAPVSLSLARDKAEAIRERLARGEELSKGKTFLDIMDDVISVKESSFRNEKHKAQWRMTLDKYAAPLHKKPIASITRDDVVECLKPIWTKIPETADRTRMRIAAVIDHAKARGLYAGDNPADWRGGLKELLPAKNKLSRGHHAALDYHLAPQMMTELRKSNGIAALVVEFLILCGSRVGEVSGAVWSEVDFEERIWTIPAERMKAGKQHRVPLTDRAIAILKIMKERATSSLIFEGEKAGSPISDTSLTKALRRASPDKSVTLHGTARSTFRDWAGDETMHARDIIETALAHSVGDATEQAYRRKDALEKRRLLMNEWAAFLSEVK
ncbi:tyrosine-type recombinase/integrase [Limoniibacter endophyticus]|nr:site-specific integrase [Limoniibacter endophyticus]